jgi:TrmH family RNA methyltransferase
MIPFASRNDLQELHRLVKEPRYREEKNLIVLQGSKIVKEWLEAGHSVYAIFKTIKAPSLLDEEQEGQWNVDPQDLAKAINLDQSAEIYHVAVIEKPSFVKPSPLKDTLVLDGLQDPGNVGTLMRSALAFGIEQVLMVEPCCDPFNEKVLRSSQGASARLQLYKSSIENCLDLMQEAHIKPWVAHAKDDRSHSLTDFLIYHEKKPCWLVIGSEGKGARAGFLETGKWVHLPMQEEVESLNAAVAGSILACYLFHHRLSQKAIL